MNTVRSTAFKAWAFLLRDFRIESGYKAAFLMNLSESLLFLVFFYFLGELIAPQISGSLGNNGGRYFPFAIIGLAFARFFTLTLRLFSESIRLAQISGCLEAMLSSQTGCVSIVLMSSLYGLIVGSMQLLTILVAALAFGVDLRSMNVLSTALVFFVSALIFVGFGVLSGAAVVWLKKGDPLTWLLGGFGTILGGAYFPVDVMPPWMQMIASALPITYSLDALRATMLRGQSVFMVAKPLGVLTLMAAVILPLSVTLFYAAVQRGRREGTLTHY
jgi:ABC-2 type transport system permease protein